jgi:hypothetical protein
VTVLQKTGLSFLISVFLFLGIVFFVFNGSIAHEPAGILALVAIFLTLFLIIFFCFNLWSNVAIKERAITDYVLEIEHEELEELEAVSSCESEMPMEGLAELEDISTGSGGSFTIFKQLFSFSPGNPELLQEAGSQVIYEQDGIHYINRNLDGDSAEKELDHDFAKLVEEVVRKS